MRERELWKIQSGTESGPIRLFLSTKSGISEGVSRDSRGATKLMQVPTDGADMNPTTVIDPSSVVSRS